MKRWMTRLHASVYGRSSGRVLGRMGGAPVLLLETTGRHTGRLWRRLTAANRYLERAARKAGHELPLLALTPRRAR